jgi:hypothetical protein
MFKTLVALVVAMTGTTAFLGWIDPSIPVPADVPTVEELIPAARRAVSEGVSVPAGRWTAIEVVTRGDSIDNGLMLTATPAHADCHFLVTQQGRLSRTHLWRSQSFLGDAPQTVLIGLQGVSDTADLMTDIQANTLRALVGAIRETAESSQAPLAVYLRD